MNISVRIAGRLLKSAVVFLMQTYRAIALHVKAKIHIEFYPNSMRKHLAHHQQVPPGTPVAADAAVVPVVPVTTNLIKQGVVHEERFHLHR